VKRSCLCGFCLFLATLSFAAAEVPESVALASGYAQAFQATGKFSVSISYTDATQDVEIRGIREMAAYGGVLLVKMRGGQPNPRPGPHCQNDDRLTGEQFLARKLLFPALPAPLREESLNSG